MAAPTPPFDHTPTPMTPTEASTPFEHAGPQAQAEADELARLHQLAARTGTSAEQQASRRQVVQIFWNAHLPDKTPTEIETYLLSIDISQPVQVINARGLDTSATPTRGFLGLGAKPRYLLSQRFPPQTPDDPVYALKATPAK